MYLNQTYSTKYKNLDKWSTYFFKSKERENCFLLLFSNLFAHAEEHIQNLVSSNSILNKILSHHTIEKYVENNLSKMIFPVISRICVYELRYASKYKLLKEKTPTGRFNEFVNYFTDEKTRTSLFEKYPVAKSIVENSFQNFCKNTEEFLSRLSHDYHEIIQTYHFPSNLNLTKIKNSGDLHNSGKRVTILEFEDNQNYKYHIVYKPRSLQTDIAFSNFIQWIAQYIPTLSQYYQTNIYRENYGWCEFIEYLPCLTHKDVEMYYHRMGSILAITHLLCSSDLHTENIIAHGSMPFFVDLECILTKPDPHSTPNQVNRHSLLGTHILPNRVLFTDEHNGVDISAISGDESEDIPYKNISWEKSGTDEMHFVRKSIKTKKGHNKPFLASGEKINPANYEAFVKEGFKETFEVIKNKKTFLLSNQSPLQYFKTCKVRTVLRATSTYGKLLLESYHPIFLNDSKKRLEHFEWLKKNLVLSKLPNNEHILTSELADLQEDNIPYFYCYANSIDLYNSKNNKVSSMPFSSFDYILKHLEQYFDDKDYEIQLILLENSFYALRLTQHPNEKRKSLFFPRNYEIQYSHDVITKIALKIAKRHLNYLTKYLDKLSNKIQWPLIESVGKNAWTASQTTTNFELYSGISGIMLTFAYASKIFKNQEYYEIFQNCKTNLIEFIETNMKVFENHFLSTQKKEDLPDLYTNIGFYDGCGGYLFALGTIEKIFPDQNIKSIFAKILTHFKDVMQHNEKIDVISGMAGFIIGIDSVKNLICSKLYKELIQKAAEHLLFLYPDPKTIPKKPDLISSKPVLGFSHGVSGIALALSKADQALKSPLIQNWIDKAIQYENGLYNEEHKNWPDFRIDPLKRKEDTENNYMMAWCHGAPGIGLSRISMQKFYANPLGENDIKNAIDSVFQYPISFPLSLCHSTLGNVDLFLIAKELKYIDEKSYQNYISDFLKHASENPDEMQFNTKLGNPGLLIGNAGVAYQMMRIANPKLVPSVLAY